MSRLRVALWFGHGVSCNSGRSGIRSQHTGSAKPYLVVNRILFYLGGPGQQGWGPCSGLLSQLLLGTTVITTLILNAKAVGMVPTTRHGAGCTMIPMLLTQ